VPVGHLAIQGTKLFYSREYQTFQGTIDIRSLNTDGTEPAPLAGFSLMASKTDAIATSATTVYLVAGANLYSVPATGGTVTDHDVPCGHHSVDYNNGVPNLVADDANLFCAHIDTDGSDDLKAIEFDGTPINMYSGLNGLKSIAIDGDDILYNDFDGVHRAPKSLPPAGSTPVIASEELENNALVVGIVHDATSIYVLTNTSTKSELWRKPRDGGEIESVVAPGTMDGRARTLLLIESDLYFVLSPPVGQGPPPKSRLKRIDKTATNSAPTDLGEASAIDLVTDGTYIYYGNGNDILRMAK
jgi:hypothetical protein